MSRKLDWDKAKPSKPTRSIEEEREWQKTDAAARWLGRRNAVKRRGKKK